MIGSNSFNRVQDTSILKWVLKRWVSISVILLTFSSTFSLVQANETASIRGKVIDSISGETLPGANVRIKDTLKGTATDTNGEFVLTGISEGELILEISYIGFISREVVIEVSTGDNFIEIELNPLVLEGAEVVVSVQARGQREAINQQKTSETAVNVVSSTKIQELPEANAAEAVGRLPGVTLQREGGEGNKVVIRGLSPQFSKVSIEGVSLSSTDGGNRSTDLSMISPFMLDGIEVTKAATANQEADQIGGTVNFKIREADEVRSFDVVAQGGYGELNSTYNDYKFVLSGSDRFLDNKLGIYVNLDFDQANRSSNTVDVNYLINEDVVFASGDTSNVAIVGGQNFQDINRIKNRQGGTLVLDYKLTNTSLQYFAMYNNVNTATTMLQENLVPFGFDHTYNLVDQDERLSIFTQSFKIEHQLGGLKLNLNGSYNRSERKVDDGIQLDAVEENAFVTGYNPQVPQVLGDNEGLEVEDGIGFLHPDALLSQTRIDTSNTYLDWAYLFDNELTEDQYTLGLSADYDFYLSDLISVNLEVGGKLKFMDREFDVNSFEHPMTWAPVGGDVVREQWFNILTERGINIDYNPNSSANFPYLPFIDRSYNSTDFLNGQLELNRVMNVDLVRDLMSAIDIVEPGRTYAEGLATNYQTSTLNDYDGKEDYYAAYIMPTIKVGNRVTLIPGFRYEHNSTNYSGVRAFALGRVVDPFDFDVVRHKRENSFLLPMLHARFNVASWFDIRASYTETLSRPSFNLITPSWIYTPSTTLVWNNPNLEPIEAQSYDLTFSFYSNKLGLISISGFSKEISNFIFQQNTYIVEEENLLDEFPDGIQTPATIVGFINNPNNAYLYGLELEWQSNFWFLPGIWSGLVLGTNYSYTYSDLTYPRIDPVEERIPGTRIRRIVGSEDASYSTRLIDQPDHVFNLSLGFDYKKFSIRGSARYNSGVFQQANFYPELRESTDPITFFDLSITQGLPPEGLTIFLNAVNINSALDETTNQGTGWYSSKEFYGTTAQLGVRYKL